jgi:uncharacterized delta-60 repeat protein
MSNFGATGTNEQINRSKAIAVDSSGKLNAVGQGTVSGGPVAVISQFNSPGTVNWQRRTTTSDASQFQGVAVDSSSNIYAVGLSTNPSGGANYDIILFKYNSSGTIQWQRALGVSSSQNEFGYGIVIDSTGNPVVCAAYNTGAGITSRTHALVAKYNSSGTIQWQKTLATTDYDYFYQVAVDSTDNVYAVGYITVSAQYVACVVKYNSSGVLQWQRGLSGATGGLPCQYNGITIDTSNNVFVVGNLYISGNPYGVLLKYNSSGVIQWQRRLGSSGSQCTLFDCSFDSSGNIYVVGTEAGAKIVMAKYDTTGTIQWQRSITSTGFTAAGNAIVIDRTNSIMYVAGSVNNEGGGNNNWFIAKLPMDGTLTGTYTVNGTSFVYATSTFGEAVLGTFTGTTTSATDGTGSLTGSTPTQSEGVASYTAYVTAVP